MDEYVSVSDSVSWHIAPLVSVKSRGIAQHSASIQEQIMVGSILLAEDKPYTRVVVVVVYNVCVEKNERERH